MLKIGQNFCFQTRQRENTLGKLGSHKDKNIISATIRTTRYSIMIRMNWEGDGIHGGKANSHKTNYVNWSKVDFNLQRPFL